MTTRYPKRLIEVDLPIARISAHARREKSIRHGHISTLHIWWARRPLAACRAVTCAALWPDPADELCPPAFREAATELLMAFVRRVFPPKITEEGRQLQSEKHLSVESRGRWEGLLKAEQDGCPLDPVDPAHLEVLRGALLDFIADFANWDNSTVPAYLETSRALTGVAHQSLSDPGYQLPPWPAGPRTDDTRREWVSALSTQLSALPRPLVVDPFAGGGSIPLEALRVGADAFASDLNPVAVLLNKVVLEYIPKYGQRLADEVRKWGQWVKEQAEQELAEFYPSSSNGSEPLAYVWARTIISEAPTTDEYPVEVPMLRSMWLAKASNANRALRWVRSQDNSIQTEIVERVYADGTSLTVQRPLLEVFVPANSKQVPEGTAAKGAVTCPVSGYTTPVTSVRSQLSKRHGGAFDARLVAIRESDPSINDRTYRSPTDGDERAVTRACQRLENVTHKSPSATPDEPLPPEGVLGFRVQKYGVKEWRQLYTPRQLLSITTLIDLIKRRSRQASDDVGFRDAVHCCLALLVSRLTDFMSSACVLKAAGNRGVVHTFGRQALPMVWDFAESNPLNSTSASWTNMLEYFDKLFVANALTVEPGTIQQGSATEALLPDDIASAWVTDPPYYDAVPYADLSDYFFVWLKRALPDSLNVSRESLTPKSRECIVDKSKGKSTEFFTKTMGEAMGRGRTVLKPDGVGIVVFAHKSTAGWESQLQAMIDAGWVVTASWPIDTEQPTRLRARESAALASSVHLVCRPREDESGTLREEVGEWRDVLAELPQRIHEWMPRLAAEGVVGADAIFACLGPALEIFSRYSRVEKASGEAVPLREYLEQVWAAVSTEALSMIFRDADAAGLEPDARLTAMWLWTLGGGSSGSSNQPAPQKGEGADGDNDADDDAPAKSKGSSGGYTLEFDAARKIAQGLGIHLEQSESIVEVKGDKATLLPVSDRTRHLFGKDEASATTARGKKKKAARQRSLFEELDALEAEAEEQQTVAGELKPTAGETVLDRVHQSMILFASGRGEALRRFLVDDGAGKDARFWKLAQSLSALYPTGTEEKRWVDGVLARKKGLGL
jgi:putative DNA methylase